MNAPEIEVDHIGIAVETHGGLRFWELLGLEKNAPVELVQDQKVKVKMLPMKNSANLEFLEPTESASTVAKFITKRGPGIHHVCLRVKNIEEVLRKLKGGGIKLINETPVAGANGARVAFVHPSSTGGVLVELSQSLGH